MSSLLLAWLVGEVGLSVHALQDGGAEEVDHGLSSSVWSTVALGPDTGEAQEGGGSLSGESDEDEGVFSLGVGQLKESSELLCSVLVIHCQKQHLSLPSRV